MKTKTTNASKCYPDMNANCAERIHGSCVHTQIAAKPAHTPGPWRNSIGTFVEAGDKILIASVNAAGLGGEGDGNARLIAAAPDLLDALKTAWNNLDARSMGSAKWTGSDQRAFEAITAAIAKAEGR